MLLTLPDVSVYAYDGGMSRSRHVIGHGETHLVTFGAGPAVEPVAPTPHPSEIVRVKLMNEYTVDFPLWANTLNDGPFFFEHLVSPQLRDDLREWAAYFNSHFDYMTGWPTHSHYEVHSDNAHSLVSRLRSELEPEIHVEHHDWEHLVAGKDQRPKRERFTAWLHGMIR